MLKIVKACVSQMLKGLKALYFLRIYMVITIPIFKSKTDTVILNN
ncbi:hypothetical protein SAMN04488008_10714 [Maribacter orientalis]|uniref:Uncharacterized protein n=1 Tax=Maribacter orientalis TaxID=228957 RepID=A0A1H7U6C2_9FLAO|nr:hypothetical protein SAMN04488008_10714 [Maribacter orientalis]